MDQLFALIVVTALALKGLADTLTFWEGVNVALIFLSLFLIWWGYDASRQQVLEPDQGGIENANPTA